VRREEGGEAAEGSPVGATPNYEMREEGRSMRRDRGCVTRDRRARSPEILRVINSIARITRTSVQTVGFTYTGSRTVNTVPSPSTLFT
jgi:hypothetical protein